VQQDEFATVRGSLLGKSLVAQTVFDSKFLLPSAPSTPEFFLVPGDNQVAIFWRPSGSETTGDVFFSSSSSAGTPGSPNLLYDPNYRQYDVEGYRVYRGRVDDPSALSMLVQYDYAGVDTREARDLGTRCKPCISNPKGVLLMIIMKKPIRLLGMVFQID
jgi:hypothetical protein